MRRTRQYRYAVVGRGVFPWDMLRHDCAAFGSLSDKWTAETERDRRVVNIVGSVEPTRARWDTFGWTVLEEDR